MWVFIGYEEWPWGKGTEDWRYLPMFWPIFQAEISRDIPTVYQLWANPSISRSIQPSNSMKNHHFPMCFLWFSYGFPMVSWRSPIDLWPTAMTSGISSLPWLRHKRTRKWGRGDGRRPVHLGLKEWPSSHCTAMNTGTSGWWLSHSSEKY